MVIQKLGVMFEEEGFEKIGCNIPEFAVYYQKENNHINAIHVVDYNDGLYMSEENYTQLKDKVKDIFLEEGQKEVHILSLVLCKSVERAKQICGNDGFCWIVDTVNLKLMIYENQIADFYGLKRMMEGFLKKMPFIGSEEFVKKAQNKSKTNVDKTPIVTISFTVINILLFLICTFTGDLLYNIGALHTVQTEEYGEYYRIFTSIFLHWDINHLISNMVILFFLGMTIEKWFGPLRFAIMYLVAGVGGNILSIIYENISNSYTISVGASGAVFGIIGALVLLVIIHKGRFADISIGRIAFMIVYSIYSGLVASDINNAAHLGGLLTGCVVASIFSIRIHKGKSDVK